MGSLRTLHKHTNLREEQYQANLARLCEQITNIMKLYSSFFVDIPGRTQLATDLKKILPYQISVSEHSYGGRVVTRLDIWR